MHYKSVLTLLFAGILLLAVGCSENATETSNVTDDPNINEAYGGYTPTDEAVAFGDLNGTFLGIDEKFGMLLRSGDTTHLIPLTRVLESSK